MVPALLVHRVSKKIMSASGVPVVPGYYGEEQLDSLLREEADKIGQVDCSVCSIRNTGKNNNNTSTTTNNNNNNNNSNYNISCIETTRYLCYPIVTLC